MFARLCNICDDYGHSNYDKLLSVMSEIEHIVCFVERRENNGVETSAVF